MTDRNCTPSSIPNQTKKYTTATFIDKAKSMHGDRYDYSKTKLINMSCSVLIICRKHGDFYQGAGIHSRGSGCSKCFEESRKIKTNSTRNGFIERAIERHGNRFCYSKVSYKNTRTEVIIICPTHGDFKQKPASHIAGGICPTCRGADQMNTDEFIRRSISVHGFRYLYRLTKFTTYKNDVKITCLQHGIFSQNPSVHMKGGGCPKCANAKSGWSRTDFRNHCLRNNKGMGTLYVIKCSLGDEIFYKIGITSKSIKRRFPSKKDMPYDYEVLRQLVSDSDEVYDLENTLLAKLNKNSYIPKIDFKGKYECFSDVSAIKKYIT